MSRLGIKDGVRAPLFDRLLENPPANLVDPPRPSRILDRDGLRESLQRELRRLLNSRAPFSSASVDKGERTVIDYGLPDYSAMDTQSREDQKRLASLVRNTIESYEPRLRDVTVEASVLGNSEKTLLVKVSGNVMIGRTMERLGFAIDVTNQGPDGAASGG